MWKNKNDISMEYISEGIKKWTAFLLHPMHIVTMGWWYDFLERHK